MKLSNTMKPVRMGLLAGAVALFLAGPVSAQTNAGGSANNAGASVNATGSGANANGMGITEVASDAQNTGGSGMGTDPATSDNGTGTGTTADQNPAGTGAAGGTNYGYGTAPNTVYKPSSGGYGLWGLLGLIGLLGMLRGDRGRVTPSTPGHMRTEEFTRPRA